MTFDAQTAKLVNGFMRIENKEKSLEARTARLAQKSKAGARGASRANAGWGKSVGSLVGHYATLGGAIGGALMMLRKLVTERKRAAEGLTETETDYGKLIQLADTPEDLQRMTGEAEHYRKQGLTRPGATDLVFKMESLGMSQKERPTFAKLTGIVDDPAIIAEGVKTLQSAIGEKETGGERNILNKLFKASQVSKTTLEQFAPAATVAAKSVKMAKGTDEEYLAALSHMAKSTKDADIAATQIDAFLAATMKKLKMTTPGILARVAKIEAAGVPDEELFELLGRKEAVRGFKGLLDLRPDILKTQASLVTADRETGTDKDVTAVKLGLVGRDPQMAATRARRVAKESRAVVEERRYGPGELKRQAAIDQVMSQADPNAPQLARALAEMMLRFDSWTAMFSGQSGESAAERISLKTPQPVVITQDKSRGVRAGREASVE